MLNKQALSMYSKFECTAGYTNLNTSKFQVLMLNITMK